MVFLTHAAKTHLKLSNCILNNDVYDLFLHQNSCKIDAKTDSNTPIALY
jgi:hypothetical protein